LLKIQVTSLTLNVELADDQFKLEVPEGVTVQKMR
jgi:outer membrane lipoprotein-sorting protein